MADLFSRLSSEEKGLLREEALPKQTKPMLAVLAGEAFSDPDWIFERKLDGERVLARLSRGHVKLISRNGREVTSSYPEIAEALEDGWGETGEGSRPAMMVDGEVVAFYDSVTSFSRLQERMQIKDPDKARQSPVKVFYYIFDLLHLGGFGLRDLPLRTRKQLLLSSLPFQDPLRYTAHRNEDGAEFHREACEKGWEGVMAKKAEAPYRSGRSRDWLKFKCVHRQEMVIGGYTEPQGSREGFGALLVGYFDGEGGSLRYAGKVGTGFDQKTLKRLARLLKTRRRKTSPFEDPPGDLPSRGVHWVTPNLVGQFGFTEWTDAGKLRHPRFLGLRRDKDPEEVVREEAG
jgi:bifunctional non-homologous end joining protein LigD